jgi:hypothetical protein
MMHKACVPWLTDFQRHAFAIIPTDLHFFSFLFVFFTSLPIPSPYRSIVLMDEVIRYVRSGTSSGFCHHSMRFSAWN